MAPLIAFSRAVDAVNAWFGKLADWMVLFACAISAGNAFIRYGVSYSSNAWLEVQWYLFAGIVMLGASYTLFRNEHVRVDLVYGNLPERGRLWVDVFGIILFMLPATVLLAWMTWPFFVDSLLRSEGSPNAGGLLRWPVKLVMPLGFLLLTLQGLSELIKRIALLRGVKPAAEVVVEYHRPEQ
ncbi:TRAP transporter small permease subunit [Siccirubricoccus sp. G192]|uniref:TRAP transporter small permease subunit n=1 Tax=Siccirubricoccus sp. G192 TaxID=2849651 RepID=UPI001C2BA2B8|nr:TRAP transporter small permease subunit [Siccirubricoccus sp. G192]MBV1796748.1 TRAP transporter small permease subunit [Siccirubricoccus sp. G192]